MLDWYFIISSGVDITGAFLDDVRYKVFMRHKEPSRFHVQREGSGKDPNIFGTEPDFLNC